MSIVPLGFPSLFSVAVAVPLDGDGIVGNRLISSDHEMDESLLILMNIDRMYTWLCPSVDLFC